MGFPRRILRAIVPAKKDDNIRELEKKINYTFLNSEIAVKALRHRSSLQQHNLMPGDAYERLEFLGDAVLGLITARYLVKTYPNAEEGELTKRKSLIVSGEILSERAREMGLGEHLILGNSERRSGGENNSSILEDTFESIVGAIYIDGGMKYASKFVSEHLLKFSTEILNNDEYHNYKSILLEHTQAVFSVQPTYRVLSEVGPDHDKIYHIEVAVSDESLGSGEGSNKKRAEQRAAKAALEKLGVQIDPW